MRDKLRSHQPLAELATRQHGVVSVRQLMTLGYSRDAVSRATAAGRLHRLHRGVYAVGHKRVPPHGRCLAAVLACGRDAVLSHFGAAWLWGLARTAPQTIDVTVPTTGRNRGSIRAHHAPALARDDRSSREGIPVTSVPRTLLDLGAVSPGRLGHAVERSEQLGLFDLSATESLLDRSAGHPGAARLRQALASYREPRFTRSKLERRFLVLIDEAGLPAPSANFNCAGYEIDAYWEPERFGVELDTYEFHGGRAAFERDRLRQEELKLAGIETIRVTGARLDREPKVVVRRIATLLDQRRRQLDSR